MKRALTLTGVFLIIVLARWVAFPDQATGSAVDQLAATEKVIDRSGDIRDQNTSVEEAPKEGVMELAGKGIRKFIKYSGFRNATAGHLIMIVVGLFFIFLAIRYDYEPLLLIPIGIGIIFGNIPFFQEEGLNMQVGIYQEGSVLNYLYFGVLKGVYPPLIFLGIGAMTDFSSLISKPKLMLLGAAAQVGIFLTFLGALALGFHPQEAGAIGIIGGADGPTAIFLASRLANGVNIIGHGANGDPIFVKNLIGPIAIAAYSYMALVPVIQPPIMKLLTTREERLIRMKPPRAVSRLEKILFPLIGLLVTAFISPNSLPLLGMLFFGNLLKESGVTYQSDRYCNHHAGTYRGGIHPGGPVSDHRFAGDLRTGCRFLYGGHRRRDHVCQGDESLLQRGEQAEPAYRGRRGFRSSRQCTGGTEYGTERGSHQPPAHACHGPQCGRSNRLSSGSRYFTEFFMVDCIIQDKENEGLIFVY